jgi:hypothetical protein
MPRTYSSIGKIRAELAWVNETPDPNNAAAVISDAVKKPDTGDELALVLSQRSSGPSDGSTAVRTAANTNGQEVKRPATWSRDKERLEFLGTCPGYRMSRERPPRRETTRTQRYSRGSQPSFGLYESM